MKYSSKKFSQSPRSLFPRRGVKRRIDRIQPVGESLESRQLLAGDLVGHWNASDLVGSVADGEVISSWVDSVNQVVASGEGSPTLQLDRFGGHPTVRFNAADGDDAFTMGRDQSPMTQAQDFTVVVVFATDTNTLQGNQGPWYTNTALVDANNLGFGEGWGVTMNSTGQLSVGMGDGFGNPVSTLYSSTSGWNDSSLHVATFSSNGGTISLQIDDGAADVLEGASTKPRTREGMTIGRLLSGPTTNAFTGEIAELRFYNGALDASERGAIVTELQSFYDNTAPVPVDDTYAGVEDAPFVFAAAPGVLANDIDADGDALTAQLVEGTTHGTIALQSSGAFVYTPDANFFGTDSFTYRALDHRSSETTATVTIEMAPVYDPAVAVNDSYKTQPTKVLNIPTLVGLLQNDVNIDDADLTAVLASDVNVGDLTLNPDGSFIYDPQGNSGTVTFTYQVNDQTRLSPPATVTLVVNTAPVAVADTYEFNEDTQLLATAATGVLANDQDADGNDLVATLETAPQHGDLVFNEDGSFQYLPAENYFGSDVFSYRITDGVDQSAEAFVQLNILSVNDLPTSQEDSYFALPDTTLDVPAHVGLLANDSDVESADLTASLVAQASHGIVTLMTDGSFTYQPNAGYLGDDSFTYLAHDGQDSSSPTTVSISITAQPVVINEFMASNAGPLTTFLRLEETGEFEGEEYTPDWIEIRNFLAQPIDLGGLYLTDSPEQLDKWQFPLGTTIGPEQYLVVFASGFDIKDPSEDANGFLHTNFQLSTEGDYLALVGGNGEIIHEYAGSYPSQRTHISYGLDANGDAAYFETPTPGAENSEAKAGLVADTQFNIDRGFYTEPFELEISTDTPNATIRYTTDGSVPTESNGMSYDTPITISRTTTVRARAFRDDLVATNVDTHSYFFIADVVEQDAQQTLDAGFPDRWRGNATDYGLDDESQFPLIAGDRNMSIDAAKQEIGDALLALPTLSIVMNVDDMFGTNGIYANPTSSGPNWERATSIEMINPDGTEGFQIDAGIRIQGGAFRGFGLTRKKSFRLLFKTTYGPGKLDYPVFGEDATDQFDTLTLRMESNDGWQWGDAGGQPQYARDQFLRQVQLAMGQPASHGRNIHLYINGFYWGMYNMVERPDESFGEAYMGSDPYAWDGQNSGAPINADGDTYRRRRSTDAWRTLTTMARAVETADTEEEQIAAYMALQGRNPDGTDNPEMEKWLDPVNYADYMLINFYGNNSDWPFKNYYFGRENSPDSDGFKFFMWDAEWSLFLRSSVTGDNSSNEQGVAQPWGNLRTSEEFRMLFADRMYKHMFNGGALYVDPQNPDWDPEHPERNVPAAMYHEVTSKIFDALIAESARWGDQHRTTPYTRDAEWQREYDRIMSSWFPQRTANMIERFQRNGLYPNTGVPIFNQRGGAIEETDTIELSADQGVIYYTLDGSDPRKIGGAVSPTAQLYSGPFTLPASTMVTVRALNGEEWSAVDQASFLVGVQPADANSLRVSEVHYHPAEPTPAETAAGFDDQDDFEFIELVNVSASTIDLSNAALRRITVGPDQVGVDFAFGDGQITQLAPGERVLVVENLAAFEFRYGNQLPVAGQWSGGLSNSSEMLTLVANGEVLQQFTYQDAWYPTTDGAGPSLEHQNVSNPDLDTWNDAASWLPSSTAGGTPGTGAVAPIPGDSNRDGIFNSADLVLVFQAGEYEDGIDGNSTFEEGDWNGDGDFTTSDLVLAFQSGNYVAQSTPQIIARVSSDDVTRQGLETLPTRNTDLGLQARELLFAEADDSIMEWRDPASHLGDLLVDPSDDSLDEHAKST